MSRIELSSLGHTWILDLDGTLLKHNGYIIDGHDSLLPSAMDFIKKIPMEDIIIILTSRTDEYRKATIDFLKNNDIRYDEIIFNLPYGERILLNDNKPSGLKMGVCYNKERNSNTYIDFSINENL